MKTRSIYDKQLCQSTFVIEEKGRIFKGTAKIHPDDQEFAAELTGIQIAAYRANIKREKHKINSTRNKIRKLENEIKNLEFYVVEHLDNYYTLKDELKGFIKSKDNFYESLKKYNKKEGL